ncbi:MAG: dCMP deaminase family protein [Thermotogaceae bacterium]|nr:dCMP deaminase family protein [Thermotogaceae bacterium]
MVKYPLEVCGLKAKLEEYLKNVKIVRKTDLRESWDHYFMKVAMLLKERSTCIHRKVGALIVKNNRILATGYNQPPSHFPHCDEIGCIRDDLGIESGEHQEICYALHAEQNALMQAARFGISTDGATMYVTHKPCSICARLIINAGIKRVVYHYDYPDPLTEFLFTMTGVVVERISFDGGELSESE